jgi:hypothetical protein
VDGGPVQERVGACEERRSEAEQFDFKNRTGGNTSS